MNMQKTCSVVCRVELPLFRFQASCSFPEVSDREERIATLEAELEQQKQKCAALERQLVMERVGVARFTYNKLIFFYTRFATYSMFQSA